MGTLVIEEWQKIGTPDNPNAPVYYGNCATTEDTTTSTSDETVTVSGKTRYVSVLAVSGDHRIAINSSTIAAGIVCYIAEGERRDIAIPPNTTTIAYESTA